jgi:hypothetical protein
MCFDVTVCVFLCVTFCVILSGGRVEVEESIWIKLSVPDEWVELIWSGGLCRKMHYCGFRPGISCACVNYPPLWINQKSVKLFWFWDVTLGLWQWGYVTCLPISLSAYGVVFDAGAVKHFCLTAFYDLAVKLFCFTCYHSSIICYLIVCNLIFWL